MKVSEVEFFMDVARRAARESKAERLKVGAVLVRDRNILAVAWNGTPPGWDNTCEELVDGVLRTKPTTLHAEKNILRKMVNSHDTMQGATLFMTHNPCPLCTADYIGLGLSALIYESDYRDKTGLKYLEDDGVNVMTYRELLDYLKEGEDLTGIF